MVEWEFLCDNHFIYIIFGFFSRRRLCSHESLCRQPNKWKKMLSLQRQNQSTINKLLMFKLNFNQNRKQKSISFVTKGYVLQLHFSMFVVVVGRFCSIWSKLLYITKSTFVRPSSFVKLFDCLVLGEMLSSTGK